VPVFRILHASPTALKVGPPTTFSIMSGKKCPNINLSRDVHCTTHKEKEKTLPTMQQTLYLVHMCSKMLPVVTVYTGSYNT
jgi:hypothetical protein